MLPINKMLTATLIWLIYLPVVGLTYVVVWLDRKRLFKLNFPRHIDELRQQQQWCIQRLTEQGLLPPNAVITGYTVTPLNQKIIFRSNAGMVEINYTHGQQAHTLRCFAKFAPTVGSVWNRTIFNLQLNHTKEHTFNQQFVANNPQLPSPKVYVTQVSALTGNLCLITELMEDCVEHKDSIYQNFTNEQLHQALKGLAQLHSSYWHSTRPEMKNILSIDNSTVLLFESLMQFTWGAPTRKVMEQSWKYMNTFETVLHGDARIGNMMFAGPNGKGRFVLFDWQAVRKGKAVYDLAYFLLLSLTEDHLQQSEESCLDAYHNYLVAGGVSNYSIADLKSDYRHACLCLLTLLSLPLLSGEASAEGDGTLVFVWGMNIWRKRLAAYFKRFDYTWMAAQYQLTPPQCQQAVNQMLQTIERRLQQTSGLTNLEEDLNNLVDDILPHHTVG